jgi:hypothetical protein
VESPKTPDETLAEPVKLEVKKDAKQGEGKVGQEKVDPKIEEIQQAGLRPPESWKPAIRDKHWKTLPPEVQAEVYRRERQVDQVLKDTAIARKSVEQFNSVANEFKDVFEYEKAPPLQTIHNLLNINRTMRFAPPAAKAQMAAQIIQGFGVDVGLLDQALSMHLSTIDPAKQQASAQSQEIQQAIAQALRPMNEFMGSLKQNREAQTQAEDNRIQSEIQAFAEDPKNVYFSVVSDAMADILELAARREQKLSLKEAYDRAILSNNDLAGTVTQQRMREAAAKVSDPAHKARSLSSMSVTGSPSGASVNLQQDGSVRQALEAAIAQHRA